MKQPFIFLCFTLCILAGCSKSDEPGNIEVSSDEVNINANGDEQTIEITSNTDWLITTQGNWFTVTPTKGSGNETLSITADPNNTGEELISYFLVSNKDAGVEKNVAVKQVPKASTLKLPVLIISNEEVMTFKYNDKYQLTEYSYSADQTYGYTVKLYYKNDELDYSMTHENSLNQDLRMNYSKNGNTIISAGQENEKGDVRDVSYTVTLNEHGLPTQIEGPYNGVKIFQYDAVGNPIYEEWWNISAPNIKITNVRQFDSHKGIFSNCTTPKWWWYWHVMWYANLFNNAIDEVYTKGTANHWVHNYTYSEDNYPMSESGDETANIEYQAF